MPNLNINLASEPFRRDRPVIITYSVLAVTLAALLAVLVNAIVSQREGLKDIRAAVDRAREQTQRLAQEQGQLEATLRRPENAEVLERSVFLNQLLLRKGISWTKIFSDLETVMPYNVRLMSVRPQVFGQNEIQLDMIVGSQAPEPVIEMFKRLERAEQFGSVVLTSSLPPSQTEPLFRYRLTVNYAQKL